MRTIPGNPWLHNWQPRRNARVRLFCLPYAGGGASLFHGWSEKLSVEIDICPIHLPGRESRMLETPFAQLTALVSSLTPVLLPYLNIPFAFFGHSMGALISFEVTRSIRRLGGVRQPTHLFLSGESAPHLSRSSPLTYHLPEPAFIEELRRLKGTPEEVLQNEHFLHLMLPLLRADFSLCERYEYRQEEILTCPITVFGGIQDEEAPQETLSAWREQTTNTYTMHVFPGDHFFLHQELNSLLRVLEKELLSDLRALTHN